MLVVDASSLCEVLLDGPRGVGVRERLRSDPDHAAPHLVDVEVVAVVRRQHLHGPLDATGAQNALAGLAAWPGERFGHRHLAERAWQLRHTVRTYDAMYVALAEALDATLLTTDLRLAGASGPRCRIEIPD